MKRYQLILLLILGLGVLIRIVYCLNLPNEVIAPDESDYVKSAYGLAFHHSFYNTVLFHVPPVTPMAFTGIVKIFGMNYSAVRIFQSLLSPLLMLVLYYFGKEICGRTCGIVMALSGGFYPYFIYFNGFALSEAIAIMVIPWALYLGFRAIRSEKMIDALLFGIGLGIASLTRAAVVDFILLTPFVFVLAWGFRHSVWVKATLIVFVGFFLIYFPWMCVNHHYYDKWIATPTIGSGVMLYQTALKMEMPDEKVRTKFLNEKIFPIYYKPASGKLKDRLWGDEWFRREGAKMIRKHWKQYPAIMWRNCKRFWQFYPHTSKGPDSKEARMFKILGLGSYGVIFPFFIFGLVVGLRKIRQIGILYLFLVYYSAVHIILYGKLRYRIPMDSLIIIFAIVGLQWLLVRYFPRMWEKIESFFTEENNKVKERR